MAGFVHFSNFLIPSEKYYNSQSCWITLYVCAPMNGSSYIWSFLGRFLPVKWVGILLNYTLDVERRIRITHKMYNYTLEEEQRPT